MNSGVCPPRPDGPNFFTSDQFDYSFELSLNSWFVRLILPAKKRATIVGNEQFKVSGGVCQAFKILSGAGNILPAALNVNSYLKKHFLVYIKTPGNQAGHI
jgi:hypothetical protein